MWIPSTGNLQESPPRSQAFGQSAWSLLSSPKAGTAELPCDPDQPMGMCHPLGTLWGHILWLLWVPWTVGVSFLQAEHKDDVAMWDLDLHFPGDGHTKVLFSHFSLGEFVLCSFLQTSLLLLALFSRIQASTTQVLFTAFIPGDLNLHFLGLKYSLDRPN